MAILLSDEKTIDIKVICRNCKQVVEISIPRHLPKEIAELGACPKCGTVAKLRLF